MPRSYSFDHFKVPQANPNSEVEAQEGRQLEARGGGRGSSKEIHYGQNHAETVRRAKAHRQEAAEEAASQPQAASGPGAAAVDGEREAPSSTTPSYRLEAAWREVRESIGQMSQAAHQFRQGSVRLLRVPAELLRLALGRA
jgi:hypothetical protein